MAQKTIVFWRDIPAQVLVKAGRKTARRELPERFIQAIDRCAMTIGAKDSDAYLAEWRRGEAQPVGDDLEQEADAALAELDADYTKERLKALITAGGHAT
ncbi:virulence factor [Stappia sp. ES.058]|uniref:virulence factor n=1 Tax=Stappia sp. ES.058 TaxID=1881061 RepID=UPI00087B2564|nr:virulence factor [Stappia sp. ES.058]SDU01239.1 Virulence factor [Stappia sp. ES.058]